MTRYISESELREFALFLMQLTDGAETSKIIEIQMKKKHDPNAQWVFKCSFDRWDPGRMMYRLKPPEPKEVWINFSRSYPAIWAYSSKEEALSQIQPDYYYADKAVHFKEVIEDDNDSDT